ncbi:MAG TPA: TonB-dependent receptor [Longimicrobiales bacterium]|nr:TonB-dependent receptor [Longimicrobiales bacterium]
MSATVKHYAEERFGGTREWTTAHRGSGEVYGEWIRTGRTELLFSASPTSAVQGDFSFTRHHQDSWYGQDRFLATQEVVYGMLSWTGMPSRSHEVLLGATLRSERYSDDTPVRRGSERRTVPGVLVQHEYRPVASLTGLWGVRLDQHGDHGPVLAPRLSLRWDVAEHTALRLNTGTGFRVVNLFTEDHAAQTGARDVVIAEALRPERSWSASLNLNHVFLLDRGEAMVDLDIFHTRFLNRIVPDYDTDPSSIIYRNLEGHGVSQGVAVAVNHVFFSPDLSYDLGVTFQDVHLVQYGERTDQLFSPRFTGVASLSWGATPDLDLSYTARITGPMRLPRYAPPFQRRERSPAWAVHDIGVSYDVGNGLQVLTSISNVLDFTQGSPLVDPGRPFGDAFDTNYVWAPLSGRELTLAVRWIRAR